MNSIVFIDGQDPLANELYARLKKSSFVVSYYTSAELFFMDKSRPDDCIYVISWSLTGIMGLEVVKAVRLQDELSTIFLISEFEDPELILESLECGVDDYVVKPFNLDALLIKLQNASKKASKFKERYDSNLFYILEDSHSILHNGLTVNLTASEFNVFLFLYRRSDLTSTREEILKNFQTESVTLVRNIDVYVSTLRKKIKGIGISVETVRGVGYRMVISKSTK